MPWATASAGRWRDWCGGATPSRSPGWCWRRPAPKFIRTPQERVFFSSGLVGLATAAQLAGLLPSVHDGPGQPAAVGTAVGADIVVRAGRAAADQPQSRCLQAMSAIGAVRLSRELDRGHRRADGRGGATSRDQAIGAGRATQAGPVSPFRRRPCTWRRAAACGEHAWALTASCPCSTKGAIRGRTGRPLPRPNGAGGTPRFRARCAASGAPSPRRRSGSSAWRIRFYAATIRFSQKSGYNDYGRASQQSGRGHTDKPSQATAQPPARPGDGPSHATARQQRPDPPARPATAAPARPDRRPPARPAAHGQAATGSELAERRRRSSTWVRGPVRSG